MKSSSAAVVLIMLCTCFTSSRAQVWEATSGPLGGSARSVTVSPAGDIFVSSLSSVFRSTDDGDNWARTDGTPGTSFMTRLIVTPDSSHLFVGSTNLGLYKSTDGGATWDRLNSVLPTTNIQDVQLGISGDLIVGSDGGGVFRSSDGGASWVDLNEDLADTRAFAAAEAGNGDLYAGTIQTGIYRRDAGETSWTALSDGLGNMRCTWLLPVGDDDMLAGTGGAGVFRISAGETTWTAVGSSIGFVSSLLITEGSVLLATTLNGVRRYDEDAETWETINEGISNLRTWELVENEDGTLYVVSDAGIFRSEDSGDTWTYQVDGYRVASIADLITLDDGTILAGTEQNGIFRTDDGGATWERSDEGLSRFAIRSLSADADGVVYVGISGLTSVARSTDGGQTWDEARNGFTGANVMALTSAGSRTYASPSTGEVVYVTEDGGGSWVALPDSGLAEFDVRALAVSSEDVVYAGTSRDGILRLVPPDTIWTLVGEDLPGSFLQSLAVDAGGGLFAGTSSGLHYSSDQGDTWIERDPGLGSNSVNDVRVYDDQTVLIGTPAGAAVSIDNGLNWFALDTGLAVTNVSSVTRTANGDVFAGTDGDGVYRTSILFTSVEDAPDVVRRFELNQNYPNPFNPSTSIGYTLQHGMDVELTIFNALGQKVRTLVDTTLPAGTYTARWDGRDDGNLTVASGIYVYRLLSGDQTSARTLVLLR